MKGGKDVPKREERHFKVHIHYLPLEELRKEDPARADEMERNQRRFFDMVVNMAMQAKRGDAA